MGRPRWRQLDGLGAAAFWLVFGVVLAFGTFTSLFIVLLPLGFLLLLISNAVEGVRSWLTPAGLVAVPTVWVVTGAIDVGAGGWVAALVGIVVVGLLAIAFEGRQRRLTSGDRCRIGEGSPRV
jgi:hypothetical protein